MSRTRREWGAEQGHLKEGSFYATAVGSTLLSELEEDAGLYPGTLWYARVRIRPELVASWHGADQFLIGEREVKAFVKYICPRLRERRELQETTGRLREERERLRQRVATLDAENEQLRQQLRVERKGASEAKQSFREGKEKVLQREQQNVSEARRACAEATAESERLKAVNSKLQKDISEAKQGVIEAQQDAHEARVEASSIHEKLEETETAFAEAERHFIRAPDLVPCLQSLAAEVKTLQETVRTHSERTAELMTTRPVEERRTVKTLHQMKRVLHDIGRFPRRRRTRAADAADDGRRAMRRGRLCYSCRCKGHLAEDCPRVRTADMVESSNPTTLDSQQRAGEPNTEASSSSGWTIFSALRRFTSGID